MFSMSSGLVIGSLLAGYLNQYVGAKWCFLIYSSMPIFVLAVTCHLTKKIDTKGVDQMQSFTTELYKSFKEALNLRHSPEICQTVLYLLLNSVFNP